MLKRIALLIVLAASGTAVEADSFVCGQWIISEDLSPADIKKKCGAPDSMTSETADTPCKKIYLVVQLMYLSRDPAVHHDLYFSLMKQTLEAAPSTKPYFERINNQILTGNVYKALKETQSLIEYEKDLLANA